jgi:hypothetical protein
MGWITSVFLLIVVAIMLAMLSYSVVVTGIEMGRRIQPFASSFLDALYGKMFRQRPTRPNQGPPRSH